MELKQVLMKARSIDTHAHVVLAETEGAAGAYGPEVLFDGEVPIYRIASTDYEEFNTVDLPSWISRSA